jgi:hypothetical protein
MNPWTEAVSCREKAEMEGMGSLFPEFFYPRILYRMNPLKDTLMANTPKKPTHTQQKPGPSTDKTDGESPVLEKIATMSGTDRVIGERIHAIVMANAPVLTPRLWYGMPAYVRDGKIVCFFQSAEKFRTRYATFGFQHEAHLDEGTMWPVSFAITGMTGAEEEKIAALVKNAVS